MFGYCGLPINNSLEEIWLILHADHSQHWRCLTFLSDSQSSIYLIIVIPCVMPCLGAQSGGSSLSSVLVWTGGKTNSIHPWTHSSWLQRWTSAWGAEQALEWNWFWNGECVERDTVCRFGNHTPWVRVIAEQATGRWTRASDFQRYSPLSLSDVGKSTLRHA